MIAKLSERGELTSQRIHILHRSQKDFDRFYKLAPTTPGQHTCHKLDIRERRKRKSEKQVVGEYCRTDRSESQATLQEVYHLYYSSNMVMNSHVRSSQMPYVPLILQVRLFSSHFTFTNSPVTLKRLSNLVISTSPSAFLKSCSDTFFCFHFLPLSLPKIE